MEYFKHRNRIHSLVVLSICTSFRGVIGGQGKGRSVCLSGLKISTHTLAALILILRLKRITGAQPCVDGFKSALVNLRQRYTVLLFTESSSRGQDEPENETKVKFTNLY